MLRQALDQLLQRPDALAQAHAAAAAGNDALFAAYVFEALRFNPNNPGVFRVAAEDYTVAKGTMRATTIPKGASVLAATQSAMFDENKVDSPNEFRVDRPAWVLHALGLRAAYVLRAVHQSGADSGDSQAARGTEGLATGGWGCGEAAI